MAVQSTMVKMTSRARCRSAGIPGGLFGGVACAVLLLGGCGDDPMAPNSDANSGVSSESSTTRGFDSPQAVFDAAKQAGADEDWGAMFDAYSPESQDRLVGSTAYGAAMVASEEAKSVLRKHGIDESMMPEKPSMTDMAQLQAMAKNMEKNQAELAAKIEDKRTFFVELLTAMVGSEGPVAAQFAANKKAQADAKLTDVEITGDSATGYQEMTINGKSMKIPVLFTRIDGSWRLHQPTMEEAQEMGRKVGEQMGRGGAKKK